MRGYRKTLLLLFCIGLSACASRPVTPDNNTKAAARITARLEQSFAHWEGTPYRWGGTDNTGMDCSAFVQRSYQEAFGIQLPRSTREQQRVGKGVHSRWLRPGDLLFFRPTRGYRHVGIYIGDNRFIHASTSAGVTRGNLNDRYWRRSLTGVRRILTPGFALGSQ